MIHTVSLLLQCQFFHRCSRQRRSLVTFSHPSGLSGIPPKGEHNIDVQRPSMSHHSGTKKAERLNRGGPICVNKQYIACVCR